MSEDCIFCQIIQGDVESWKVYESDFAYAFLDTNPVNEYHTLVAPKSHCTNVFDASSKQLTEVISAAKHVIDLYAEKLGIEDVQILNSSGEAAQQDVFHLHFHIIPRHKDDRKDIELSYRPELKEKFDELIVRLDVKI